MKQFIYNFILIALSFVSYSQTLTRHVIASEGDWYSNSNGSLSWTIGEISIETYSNLPKIITQGFQQPDSLMFTGIKELENNFSFYISPNPTKDYVFIKSNFVESYDIECTDLLGKMMFKKRECSSIEKINLSEYPAGTYFIVVSLNKEGISKKMKCVKID